MSTYDVSNATKGPFDPADGYLTGDMWLKDALHAQRDQKLINFEHYWNDFISRLTGENIYLRYVPEHLKEAAAKSRADVEKKAIFDKKFKKYVQGDDEDAPY